MTYNEDQLKWHRKQFNLRSKEIEEIKKTDMNVILEHIKKSDDGLDKIMNYIDDTRGCEPFGISAEQEKRYGVTLTSIAGIIIGYIEHLKKKLDEKPGK